jgi:hypothetical protein
VRRVVKSIVEGAAVVRRDPETTKRALSIRMRIKDAKELDESYQQLRDFTQAKPYPSLDGFKAILGDLAIRMPEARNADRSLFVFSSVATSPGPRLHVTLVAPGSTDSDARSPVSKS